MVYQFHRQEVKEREEVRRGMEGSWIHHTRVIRKVRANVAQIKVIGQLRGAANGMGIYDV